MKEMKPRPKEPKNADVEVARKSKVHPTQNFECPRKPVKIVNDDMKE